MSSNAHRSASYWPCSLLCDAQLHGWFCDWLGRGTESWWAGGRPGTAAAASPLPGCSESKVRYWVSHSLQMLYLIPKLYPAINICVFSSITWPLAWLPVFLFYHCHATALVIHPHNLFYVALSQRFSVSEIYFVDFLFAKKFVEF